MKLKILALAILFSQFAHAQPKPAVPVFEYCKEQVALYCSEVAAKQDFNETLRCLGSNHDKLNTECKQELQRFAQAVRQSRPPGGGPLGAFAGLAGVGAQVPSASYEGRHIFTDKSPNTEQTEHSFNASSPVYWNERSTIAASFSASDLHFSQLFALDSSIHVPENLRRIDAGLSYSRKLPEQKRYGVRGTIGYAGDKFNSHTQSFTVTANYSYPGANEAIWIWMVMISNNSPFGTFVPVPGFLYIKRTPTFTGVFGVPVLSMQWTPVNPWAFSLSLFGPQVKSEASYGAVDKTQIFTGFSWKQQRFILSESVNDDERLTIEEKNFEVGVRRPLSVGFFFEAQGGYAFDRKVYLGDGLFAKEGGRRDLISDWYIRSSLKFAF